MRAAYWKAAAVVAVAAAALAWTGGPTAGQPPAPAAKAGAK